MIVLAYDGSVNDDWVARYAMRLAAHSRERTLKLFHVETGEVAPASLDAKLRHIEAECAHLGIALEVETDPLGGGVFETLRARVPQAPDTFLVCGARLHGGRRGYLAGTVSERLLEDARFNVLAVRCVQPGLLGDPHEFLWPLHGRREEVGAGIPFLGLFAPAIRHLRLLRVMTVGRFAFRRLRPARVDELRRAGLHALERVESEVRRAAGIDVSALSLEVRVSDERVQEIVIAANRFKSQLILLWAPADSLGGRFFFGNPLEQVMGNTPCDVAVYRGAK